MVHKVETRAQLTRGEEWSWEITKVVSLTAHDVREPNQCCKRSNDLVGSGRRKFSKNRAEEADRRRTGRTVPADRSGRVGVGIVGVHNRLVTHAGVEPVLAPRQ